MTTLRAGIFGQNIAQRMVLPFYTGVLQAELQRSGNTVETSMFAASNSSILKVNARSDVTHSHWWNEVDDTAGPALEQAKNYITLATNKPEIIIFDPGTLDGVNEGFDQTIYRDSLKKILAQLQTVCNPDEPSQVRICLLYASRHGGNERQDDLRHLRRAQYAIVQELNASFLDIYDLPALMDHPLYPNDVDNAAVSVLGMSRLCYRMAHVILRAFGLPSYRSPVISVTRMSTHTVAIQINDLPSNLNMPAQSRAAPNAPNMPSIELPHLTILRPGGFVPYPDDWRFVQWNESSSGTVLIIELMNEELPTGAILLYPDKDLTVPFTGLNTMRNETDMVLTTFAHVMV